MTIPRAIRETLDLYIGQTLNWDLIDEGHGIEIRIYPGEWRGPFETAAHQTISGRKSRRKKIRKSDIAQARKALIEAWQNGK